MRTEATGRPVVVVARSLPDPRGSAPARLLHGFAVGARRAGRDVSVWSWWPGPAPADGLPSWVRWDRLPPQSWPAMKARALLRPRSDVVTARWQVPDDAIAVAEDFLSFAAVRSHPASVSTLHYSTALDARAVGWSPVRWQDFRAERAAAVRATVTTAYSARVAAALPGRPRVVPCALEPPPRPLDPLEAPVAACVADWRWAPNQRALGHLLAAWPQVRRAVPGARLLLAGYGDPGIGAGTGVSWLGPVRDSTDVLAQAALLAFPCPPSSGPKVKVLEAASLGLPVVTTPAGVEGLHLGGDAVRVVADASDTDAYAAAVAGLLADPAARAGMAAAAHAAVRRWHAPETAAAARLAVIDEALA